jgi:acetyltransferase
MTYRAIRSLFEPRQVLYVPSPDDGGREDSLLARNLAGRGFAGEVQVARASRSGALQGDASAADLAVVELPQPACAAVVEALAERRCKAILLVGVGAALSADQRERIRETGRRAGIRVLGPSRTGVVVPGAALYAGHVAAEVPAGPLALVTQSDSIATSMIDWAAARAIGFSRVVSVGELSAVALGDVLDYLALDPRTRAVLIYVERIADARRFMSAARAAARLKPVMVVRGGASVDPPAEQGFAAGRLVTADEVYAAAFARAGLVRVPTTTQLFDAATALAAPPGAAARSLRAGRLAIVGNGRAPALLAADMLVSLGGVLASPSADTLAELEARLPPGWSGANPLDLGPDASPAAYRTALECLARAAETDAVLAVHGPSAGSASLDIAQAVATAWTEALQPTGITVLASWVGDADAAEARQLLAAQHIPVFATSERAVRAFQYRVAYERARELLRQIPSSRSGACDAQPAQAAALLEAAAGQSSMEGAAVLGLLAAYGVALEWSPAKARAPGAGASVAVTCGMRLDAQFGPVLYFGLGGAALAAARDLAVALPPLNDALARALLHATRIGRMWADGPATDALQRVLVALSRLVAEHPAVAAIELEACVDADGSIAVVAAQAELADAGAGEPPAARLAIRPYPAELESTLRLRGGEAVRIRPIRPEDARSLQSSFGSMAPEDVRMRLFAPVAALSDDMAARMTQVDYDREMAFVIEDPQRPGELWGGARVVADPDQVEAEFSVTVRSDVKGRGVGAAALARVLDYAAERGLATVWGSVLADNRPMLRLAERMGFRCARDPDDPEVMKCVIDPRARRAQDVV